MDRTVREYLAEVAAPAPSATGGSVCAITVAAAAGLVGMTAGISRQLDDAPAIEESARELRERAVHLAGADSASYRAVCTVQRLAQDSPACSQAVRDALIAAAQPPLKIAKLAAEVASLAALLSAHGNQVARGDAITAASLAAASARSAATLVRINLTSAGLDTGGAVEAEAAASSAKRSAQLAQDALANGHSVS
ncbi:formiminotetrahydrofolate cyclodeaminase [Tamaricihabitans halophyticus]|uniref:Formiminotetrahydrofolate cyclodeaminase n=1 Tax=Tamaricihabitans halophyticus TaxID=1262583 RepID=A0A4R2QSE7_9PSEU|nr:cyclodeaminase/cyclohydrolase family protein [Tamaricihabitans halophyticus]TCP52044.1 formiminotetrahydrofolate cyclodeaminase [Tamaricihabitans halophyticus]